MASRRDAYQDFGIVPAWFENFGAWNNIGPQAFVGFESEVDNPFDHGEDFAQAYTDTLQIFYVLWMSGIPLAECIQFCSNPANVQVPFPVPGNENYTVNDVKYGPVLTCRLIIVGHPGLKVDGLDSSWDINTTDHFRY